MKYFLDTEFIEYPNTIELISIGIVAEDGREYYAINAECKFDRANQWVKDNVISKLEQIPDLWNSLDGIKRDIRDFIGSDKPIFWGYYADYDWVVFCWLFGPMIDLPKGWPMYCRDVKQLADMLGNPELPKQEDNIHNALADARWNKETFLFLREELRSLDDDPLRFILERSL